MGMTEAYSMINKKLQNVVAEHAYLEKPKEKLKVEGWGTTNIAIICGQEIFVGVDKRGTSGDKKGFIENQEATKLCLINYCNILVAMAGDSAQSVEVLMDVNKELRNAMQTTGAVDDNIHLAANKAHEYIGKWESEYGKEFQGSIVLAGFEKKDGSFYPHTYVVRSSRFVHTSNDNDAILNGSGGGAHIWDYFLTWRPEYIEGVLEKMKRALLYASIFDEMSGGFLRVVKLTQSSFNTEYYKSVLEALFDHCDEFAACLSHSLIFLWYRRDQGYTHEFNVLVDGVFKEKLLGYNYNVVIGLKGTFVVRLVHFHRSICDEPYEEVRRKHEVFAQNRHMRPQHLDDHDVPSQVQALPWIIIDELGTSPILFGKLTHELVGALLHV